MYIQKKHEERVKQTFEFTIQNAATSLTSSLEQDQDQEKIRQKGNNESSSPSSSPPKFEPCRPMRILEVGVGATCRTILRGMYDDAFQNIDTGIEFIGIDLDIPNDDVVQKAKEKMVSATKELKSPVSMNTHEYEYSYDETKPLSFSIQSGDITTGLPFPDGYFDAITSSLLLCSVDDQSNAIAEIKRLLNPNGGVYGFIEHVAVNRSYNNEKDLILLELSQEAFDPLQQLVAHNCHLHRNTDTMIKNIFGEDGVLIQEERYIVDDMWPVSCQSRGALQLKQHPQYVQ